MAIINGVDQENVKSFSGAQGTLKLSSKEVVVLSRPAAYAFLYDPDAGSLTINGAAAKTGAGWLYPVYSKRPEKIDSKTDTITEYQVTTKLGKALTFYGVTKETTAESLKNDKDFKLLMSKARKAPLMNTEYPQQPG